MTWVVPLAICLAFTAAKIVNRHGTVQQISTTISMLGVRLLSLPFRQNVWRIKPCGPKLCKKNYMISYDINQTGWTKRLLILLDGNIGMKPPMYSTHQHGAQKWVYCDAKPRTFFGISVSHKTFHHVNSNFELLDIMTKCLDQSPSWQVFDQKTIRTNCIRHQCVNHSGFTELKNFSGTTKFNDYDRRIQTTIRRKHR